MDDWQKIQFLEHLKDSFHTFIVPQFVEEFVWPKPSKEQQVESWL